MALRDRSSLAIAVAFSTVIAALIPLTDVAAADSAVVLGGSAGINVGENRCTLGSIGHDHTGGLVGFTAGHCGGPGTPVTAEGAEGYGPVGIVVAADGHLDYAVIKFDSNKVTPTANFGGFPINGIGPDPEFRQLACTQGAATGNHCSHIPSLPGSGPTVAMHAPFQPGDDGRPVTCDGLLVGLTLRGDVIPGDLQGLPPIPDTFFRKFSAIMENVNAGGGPGAGFTPTPA